MLSILDQSKNMSFGKELKFVLCLKQLNHELGTLVI